MKNRDKILISILLIIGTLYYSKDMIKLIIDNKIGVLISEKQMYKANIYIYIMTKLYDDPKAKFALGVSYDNGIGTEKNLELAKKYYMDALNDRYSDAAYNLGILYINNNDKENGLKYLSIYIDEMSGEKEGLSNAYMLRGYMYYTDIELLDLEKAFSDFNESINYDNANSKAILNVGIMYMKGQGVDKNIEKGISYIKKAAMLSNAQAQYNLGLNYLNGDNISKDLVLAERWLRIASDNDFKAASCDLIDYYINNRFEKEKEENMKNAVKYSKRCVNLN